MLPIERKKDGTSSPDLKAVASAPQEGEEGKVTLLDIKRRHGLSTYAIAAVAGVEPGLVYWMEQRGILLQKDLEKILGGISRVTGQNYSMETVGGYWVSIEKQV